MWSFGAKSGDELLGNVSSQLALQEELAYGRAIDGSSLERLKRVCAGEGHAWGSAVLV